MTTTPSFPYDVFLSHNGAQKDWTRELARRLRDDGFQVWFDEFDMPKQAGKNWIDSLEKAVEQSRKVVLVWSPDFFTHEWPKFEANILQLLDPVGDKERILPILHTCCDLPKRWAFLQSLDFTGCAYGTDEFEFHYHHLLHSLDNSRPYEGDFQRFLQQRRQQQNQNPEKIPPVSPLPKGSRMPRATIGNFVGREKELRELAHSLTPGSGSLVGVHAAVTGMGGVGKTQLAIEYAHRYGRLYRGGVFWINLEKAEDAVTEVASCGAPQYMNLERFDDRSAPEQAALVHKLWEDGEAARLLIFDNAEEHDLVEKWRPKYGHCSVLITSRRDYWPLEMNVQSMPIETLPRPNSMELLEKARPGLLQDAVERQAANDLCEYLGDLPLALQVASAYLQRFRGERVQNYLHDLGQTAGAASLLEKVWRCFAISYRKLDPKEESDALAMRLFQLAGYFAPVSIARHLLAEAAELDPTRNEDRRQLNRALTRLQELALIAEEPDGRLLLHRLLWEFSRQQQLPLNEVEAALFVADVLLRFANEENASGLPQKLLKERVHLRQAALEAERRKLGLTGALYNELGHHGHMLALLQEAKLDYQRASNIDEDAFGPGHPTLAIVANNIGAILRDQGDLAGALEYIQRALKIDEKIYGPDHPNVAVDANNIGEILRNCGEFEEALKYTERALHIAEKLYGPNHPYVSIYANNIGLILQDQGSLAEALEYIWRALNIDERIYGPGHPKFAIRANNIGQILRDQGDLKRAREYTQRALEIDEKVYGPDHPNVATDANNIGLILWDQGDLVAAMVYVRRALTILEKIYGADNPKTKECAGNLRYLQQLMNEKTQK
jgi:tetratricopeptide (TPR) repeat protein